MNDSAYPSVGGKRRVCGNDVVWDFGYHAEPFRSRCHSEAIDAVKQDMPRFAISTRKTDDPKKVELYKVWNSPKVVAYLGFPWTGTHQFSGSCVWAGLQNVACTLHFTDVLLRNEPEKLYVPFGLLNYGRSRYYLGDRSPGEGSSGSTMAQSCRDDGWLDAKGPGRPTFRSADGIEWGESIEMSWSDGDAQQTLDLLPESRQHLVRTVAQCHSADDVRAAIRNLYPVTCASMYAHDGGTVQSDPPICVGRKQGQWSHQMSILGFTEHPKLGELFWLQNQWGLRAHTLDPFGGPPGGVWITKADVDWICRDEVFAFSQYDGFPAQEVPLDFLV